MKQLLKKRKVQIASAIAVLILAIPLTIAAIFLVSPAGSGTTVQIIDFAPGESLKKFAGKLEKAKLISSSRLFVSYARIRGEADRLKAGTYQFNDGMVPAEILRRMVSGDVYVRSFSVPEGYSIYQVAELLEAKGFFTSSSFLHACTSKKLLSELGISGSSVEGYLYPSTYDVKANLDEEGLIRLMVAQFNKVYAARFAEKAKAQHLSMKEVVILASMIEKEAVEPSERPVISSVFHNRLSRKMRLQSDPTAVYGIRAFSGSVSKKDILRSTPYNTYLIDALPPGPIGNPSSDAIEAAISPASTGYYYFVAKKDGTHHFSTSLEEHNQAVRDFLKKSPGADSVSELRNDRQNLTRRRQ